jgi:hypothetical protein
MKNIFRLLSILFLFQSPAFAQQKDALYYSDSITIQQLKRHLYTLASADMEGRGAGTRGAQKAVNYITQQFAETGLSVLPEYQQQFEIYKDTMVPIKLHVGAKKFILGTDYLITSGSQEENQFAAREIVFAGYGISTPLYDDYTGLDVRDKVVVIFPDEPKQGDNYLISGNPNLSEWGLNLSAKIKTAKEKGALALLVVNPSEDVFMTSKAAQPAESLSPAIPVVNITRAMFSQIFDEKISREILSKKDSAELFPHADLRERANTYVEYGPIKVPAPAFNIIGMIPGSAYPNEYVFITAHYDHIGITNGQINYGADDNGSGISTMLTIAKAFKQAADDGAPPKRSIVFIAFSGEELGLLGSAFYTQNPIFPLDNISADLNIDMIGRVQRGKGGQKDRNYLYVIGNNRLSTDLNKVIASVKGKTTVKEDYKYNNPNDPEMLFYRSDHYNFAEKGVPVLFFTNGVHEDYHLPGDTADKIEFDVLKNRSKYIFLIAWEIANYRRMLKRNMN